MTSSRLKQWSLNGLLLFIALVVTIGIAEVAVRFITPQPTGLSHQDRYGLPMHWPGLTRYLPQFKQTVSFNSVGMRDREHTLEKPAGTFRILVLGDSFMEALQVALDSSLPGLLESGLKTRTGREIEVINGGVSGWGTDDALRYLTMYGVKYQPDLVVVAMTLHNDISDNLRQDWHRLDGDTLLDTNRPPMSWAGYKKTQLKAWLSTRFQLYQLWRRMRHGGEIRQGTRQLVSHVEQLFTVPTPPVIAKGVKLTDLELRQIQATATAAGARVAVVLLPLKYQLSDSTWAEFAKTVTTPSAQLDVNHPQSLIRPILDSMQVPVVDLLPAFRSYVADSTAPLYLEWDGHWNENGHRLAARTVVDELLQAGVVPNK